MSKSPIDHGRRRALKLAVASAAAVPISALLASATAHSADLPHVSEEDPAAVGLKYLNDATQASRQDKMGTPGDQQLCSNCQFIQADTGEWRPCTLFPGKAVNENGWCSAWAKKVG